MNDFFFHVKKPNVSEHSGFARIYSSLPACWSSFSFPWGIPANLEVKAFLDHGQIWLLLSPGILYKIPECGLEIDLENPIKLQVLAAIQAKFIGWKKYGLSIVLFFTFLEFLLCACGCVSVNLSFCWHWSGNNHWGNPAKEFSLWIFPGFSKLWPKPAPRVTFFSLCSMLVSQNKKLFLNMNYASVTADVHICQLGTTPQIPVLPLALGRALFFLRHNLRKWDHLYCFCWFCAMVMGQWNKLWSLYLYFSLFMCAWCSTRRLKPSSHIWSLETYLVLTEWICCCEAPRPSRWRIHSHVSTRDGCPSPSATVPGSHLPRACLWSL